MGQATRDNAVIFKKKRPFHSKQQLEYNSSSILTWIKVSSYMTHHMFQQRLRTLFFLNVNTKKHKKEAKTCWCPQVDQASQQVQHTCWNQSKCPSQLSKNRDPHLHRCLQETQVSSQESRKHPASWRRLLADPLTCGSDGRARRAHSCKPVSEGAQGHAAEYEAPSPAAEARSCPFRLLLRLTFQQAGWLTELLTHFLPSFLPGLLSFWNG